MTGVQTCALPILAINLDEMITDGWVNGWVDGWRDAWMPGWMDRWEDRRMDGAIEGGMGLMDVKMDG